MVYLYILYIYKPAVKSRFLIFLKTLSFKHSAFPNLTIQCLELPRSHFDFLRFISIAAVKSISMACCCIMKVIISYILIVEK